MPMLVLLVPPLPGGRVTFPIASWNIRSGWGAGLGGGGQGAMPNVCRLRGLNRDQTVQQWISQIHLGISGDLVEGGESTSGGDRSYVESGALGFWGSDIPACHGGGSI